MREGAAIQSKHHFNFLLFVIINIGNGKLANNLRLLPNRSEVKFDFVCFFNFKTVGEKKGIQEIIIIFFRYFGD